ncbi:hypothetical protein [Massilia niastensis]|uniref:hypothetical protein n=1 Tax=Massilia niastensis TaxID=544911 RepID=UPI0012EB318C|nr:hypothetical protein [Massilia niastensis]
MKHALLNGKPVEAEWAAEQSDDAFAGLRTQFSCVDCKAQAYLNRGSPHQAAYFASKNHTDDCNEAYQGASGSDAALVKANAIVIVVGGSSEASDELHRTKEGRSPRRTSLSQGNEVGEIPTRRGAGAILQELLVHPEFATSSKKIVVGKVETVASEFFVPFLQLGPQHIDRLIGVWGEASSFRELTSIAFLNRGDEKVDIRIPQSIFSELKKLYRFTSAKELAGAKFFLIGTFNFLMECRISDVKQIALQIKAM